MLKLLKSVNEIISDFKFVFKGINDISFIYFEKVSLIFFNFFDVNDGIAIIKLFIIFILDKYSKSLLEMILLP